MHEYESLLNIRQTAELLSTSIRNVRYLRETGKLTPLKNQDGRLRFGVEEVLDLKAQRERFVPVNQQVG